MTEPRIPPKGEERQLLSFCQAIDGEAESAKREIQRTWEENIRQVRGDQWRIRRAPYFLANVIKNQVRKKVATLTESKPQFRVHSVKPDLDKAANVLYNATKAILDRSNVDDVLWRVAQFGMTVGSSFVGIPYDSAEDDILVTFIDPRRVFLDPAMTEPGNLDKAQYVRIDTVLPLADIRQRFPGRGSLVSPDERHSGYSEGAGQSRSSLMGSILSQMPRIYRPGSTTKRGPIPRAEIREYWIRDPQLNDDGFPLFPTGRHVIRAGNVILIDEMNPYWDGGWPIEMFEWDPDFESPWGQNEVQDLRRIQESVNRIGDAWVRNLLLGSNFKVIADIDALDPDQWDKLDNEAGMILKKKPSRELRYEPPVAFDPSMPNTLEGLIKFCDMLTGNSDSRGGGSAAQGSSALEGLQMARQVLIRATARRMESLLERVGQKLISRIFQFLTSDRVLFQQGPSHDWLAYTYVRQELLQDDHGTMRSVTEREQMFRDFKFLITPGSSLASTRIQRTMALLQLRAATGVAPSVRRILAEADIGDPDSMIKEGIEESQVLPAAPVPKGRGGKQ